ncbi:MAG: carboxypeptidase-like regulatory domain-containing protein, partial [Acidobacteriaceae bacterium]
MWFLLLLLAFGLTVHQGFGQMANSTLRGTVKDNSGASVVGAKITLSEPATGRIVRQAVSSASGDYEFDELQPGTYTLRCDQSGFKSFDAENILLDPCQTRRVDPTLAVGATATQVLVSAGAAVMNTETAAISATFSAKENDRTPLVNIYPSMYSLLTTASGVQGGFGGFPVMNG